MIVYKAYPILSDEMVLLLFKLDMSNICFKIHAS